MKIECVTDQLESRGDVGLSEVLNHVPGRGELNSALESVVRTGESPPIKATLRVGSFSSRGLRIENDDVVGIGP